MLSNLTHQLSQPELNNLTQDLFDLKKEANLHYQRGNFIEAMNLFEKCL